MLSYTAAFLIEGLKLPWTKEITVQRLVGDSEIEWALGAAYKELEDLFTINVGNLRSTPLKALEEPKAPAKVSGIIEESPGADKEALDMEQVLL